MSSLDPDLIPDPARFVLRPARRLEVIEGDPRTLALELIRGNHGYTFPVTPEEANELAAVILEDCHDE